MSAIKPRTKSVVVYSGDDLENLGDLSRQVTVARNAAEAASKSPRRFGDDDLGDPVKAAEDAYDAAVDEAASRALVIEVRAMPGGDFRDLMAAHSPRADVDNDRMFSVNTSTFAKPFLDRSVVAMHLGDSELPPAEWAEELRALSEGDGERLFSTAYWLNRAPGADPKESKFSTGSRSSTET